MKTIPEVVTEHPDDCWNSKAAATRDWEARWTAQVRTAPARANNTPVAKAFEGGHLRLYEKLAKAEGSAPYQARRKRSGFKSSYSNVSYLGLLLLHIHADGIKPQPTFSPPPFPPQFHSPSFFFFFFFFLFSFFSFAL